tara:strand:- start:1198 stop:2085 length:888 start_codon:yes stop_codon:yes gene_type:complete
MIKKYNFFQLRIFFLIIIPFIFGIISKTYIKKTYLITKTNLNKFLISRKSPNCLPEIINEIPKNSSIIVGHAYGSPTSKDLGISKRIRDLYKENKKNINMIIFSGDLFQVPSIERWKKFYSEFDNDLDIYIAPGNHDIGLEDSVHRDIFKLIKHRNQANYEFPFSFQWSNNTFIIDDSNTNKNSINKIFKIIEEDKNKNIYIIRHHILPKSLSFASNAKGPQPYINDWELNKEFIYEKNKNITFIYGDSGAKKYLPRISCIKVNNINHIANGIGGFKDDIVLVLSKNKIFIKKLN